MPVFSNATSTAWEDPDLVPRPVVTIGAAGIDTARTGHDETHPVEQSAEAEFHQHRKGQFLLWMRGVLTCEVAGGFWLVPPGGAIWIPGGVRHRMQVAGTVECYVVYVDPAAGAALPQACCTLSTTPLLRELVIRSADLPMRYEETGMASRTIALLLDEMALAQPGQVHLPMPADSRLHKLVAAIIASPSEPHTIDD